MGQHAEHLVAGPVAGDGGPDALDDAGVVAPEHDGERVLDHPVEHAGGDRVVDGVGGGRLDPHEHLVVGEAGLRQVIAEAGRGVELVERECAHGDTMPQADSGPLSGRQAGGAWRDEHVGERGDDLWVELRGVGAEDPGAASTLIPGRYGRAEVMASKTSATASTRIGVVRSSARSPYG